MTAIHPPPPLTYSLLARALSTPRLAAYSREDDRDSVDAIARYLWNMSVGGAIWPTVHLLEVAVRNVLFEVGQERTKGRVLTFGPVGSWLDAGLLMPKEQAEVDEAIKRLGAGRRTPGHLIAELTLGFWVRVCNSPYEQGDANRPRLWPSAAFRFQYAPRRERNREDIRKTLDNAKDIRNRIAHHHPLWDRNPVRMHEDLLKPLGWLYPEMADAARTTSAVRELVKAGPVPYRALAESLTTASARLA